MTDDTCLCKQSDEITIYYLFLFCFKRTLRGPRRSRTRRRTRRRSRMSTRRIRRTTSRTRHGKERERERDRKEREGPINSSQHLAT
jgi:hypothetical protein